MSVIGAVSAGLGAVSSLGGQLISGRQQRRNIRDQGRHNIELAQFAHDRNVELWKKQTAYNTPEQQMQRFREAGLNPHLMYQQGQPGLAGEAPQMATPQSADFSQRGPMLNPMQALSEHLDVKGKKQQIANMEQQIITEEARGKLMRLQGEGVFQQNTIRAVDTTIASYMMQEDMKSPGSLRGVARAKIGGMKAEQWLKQATNDLKRWEANFATEHQIHPRDSIYWRMGISFLESLGFSPKQIQDALK